MTTRTVAVRLLLNPAAYLAGSTQINRANAAMTAGVQATAARATAATGAMTAGLKRTGASLGTVAAQAGLMHGGLVNPLTAAGAAVLGVTKASIDWESAWAGVTKTVDGSATQMERLEGDLRNMATELPATHGEIAAVAEAAGQLGVKVDDVSDFTRTMVDLGETTNLSAEQAATSIARLTNIMGTSKSDVDRLGSTLVDLGNNSATTEAEILTLGTRLAAAGNIAGLSESDVLAFAATLTSVGVEAEAGGTALSKVFTSVRDAVLSGGQQLEKFAEVAGTSASDFAAAFREDPAQAIASFIEGLGRMNAAGQSATGVFQDLELTDQRLMRALLSTAEAGDLLTDSIELGSEAWQDNTALTEEAEKRYATTAAQLKMALNQIKDAAIDAGGAVAPVLQDLATLTGDVAQGAQALGQSGFGSFLGDVGNIVNEAINPVEHLKRGVQGLGEVFGFTDEAIDAAAGSQEKFDAEIEGLLGRLPAAVDETRDYRTVMAELADVTRTGTENLAAYQEQVRASTDPVFALQSQLQAVEEAQSAYNDAVDEYGKNSPEAEAAAFDLATAVASAEQAALDGDLSFDAFDARLQRWVEQGVITAEQADIIRGRVEDLTAASEDYDDIYTGQMEAGGVSKAEAEINGLINRANDYDGSYTAQLRTGGTTQAEAEINGLLNRLAAFRGTHRATVNVGATGSGLGVLFGSAGLRHSGGPIMHEGGQVMHDGGSVNAGVTRMHDGGLRTDERVVVAQQGEFMMQRSAVDTYGVGFMHAVNQGRAIPLGGGTAGRGDMGGGHLTGDLYLSSGEFLGVVQGEVKQGISESNRVLKSRTRAGAGRAR